MKIDRINLYIVRQDLGSEKFSYSQAWYSSRTMLLLEMITEDGIIGWGEAFGNPYINKAILEQVYIPLVLGMDPLDRDVIWRKLYNSLRDHGQKGTVIEAISAIDIALWDIAGKASGLPVYKLMGGAARNEITPYATGFYRTETDDPDYLLKEAEKYLEQGFLGMKIKIGFGIENDVKLVHAIRKLAGDGIALMLDANHAYNASDAIALADRISDCSITWFEEPVPPEDIQGYCEVKSKIHIPVAGGEAEFTRYGFYRLLASRAVDIVQPDCCVTGGLSEFRNIATLANIQNIRCCPHIWGSAIALQAGINAAFYVPDYPDCLTPAPVWLEYDRTPNIFREELNELPLDIKDGRLKLQNRPGLGVIPDRKLIEKYSVL